MTVQPGSGGVVAGKKVNAPEFMIGFIQNYPFTCGIAEEGECICIRRVVMVGVAAGAVWENVLFQVPVVVGVFFVSFVEFVAM